MFNRFNESNLMPVFGIPFVYLLLKLLNPVYLEWIICKRINERVIKKKYLYSTFGVYIIMVYYNEYVVVEMLCK